MGSFGLHPVLIISIIVVGYVVITTGASLLLRSRTNDQFMVAARALPVGVVGVVLMSEFIGTPATVGTAQSAYTQGIAAAWSIVSCIIAFPLFGLVLAPRIYKSGQYTISGAIATKYGNTNRLITSVISIYALFLVNVSAYLGGAAAISTVYKISLPMAALVTAVISTTYYSVSGLKGVAYVSVAHAIFKYLSVGVTAVVALHLAGGFSNVVHHMPAFYFTWDGKIGTSTIVAWTIGNIGSIFATQQIVLTMSGARNASEAKRACFYAGIWCVPMGILAGLVGVVAKFIYPNMKSIYALPIFIQHMNPVLGGLVTAGIVAAIFGGVATVSLGMTSLVVRDFVVPYFDLDESRRLRVTRIAALLVGFAPLPFVLLTPGLLKVMFFSKALRTSVALVAVAGFCLPNFSSPKGAFVGLLGGLVGATAWFFAGNPYGIDNTYIAAVIPIAVMTFDHWAFRARRAAAAAQKAAEAAELAAGD